MFSYTSEKNAYNNALNLKLAFANNFTSAANSVGYVFIGKHLSYPNEPTPTFLEDTSLYERELWDNMFAAKRIREDNLELVLPRYDYESGVKYQQYDDTIKISDLVTTNTELGQRPMYVINDSGNVYKCLSNDNGNTSLQMPEGDYLLNANGNVYIPSDGYVWKYLYNVDKQNDFQTENWMPVPISLQKQGYNTSKQISIDGEIATVQITNSGSGYIERTIKFEPFPSSCTVLTITSDTFEPSNTIVVGMGVSGNGVLDTFHILGLDTQTKQITLSLPTTASGGGTSNTYNLFTRVAVSGDGEGINGSESVICRPIIVDGSIQKIVVTEPGKNYNFANVVIYGTGTGATARAIVSPKFGHGFNPAKDLGAKSLIVSMKFGESGDATEGGVISEKTTFRQFGILIGPHKYNETSPVSSQRANGVISQTFDIDLESNLEPNDTFSLNEFVYQGISSTNYIFGGYVNDIDENSSKIKLTGIIGTPSPVALLKSASVPTGRKIKSWSNEEFQKYTGDIIYAENIEKIQRDKNQTETIRMIIKF